MRDIKDGLGSQVEHAISRLTSEFDGVWPREIIAREFHATMETWRDAPVKMHVPVLAERRTRERLRLLARSEPSNA